MKATYRLRESFNFVALSVFLIFFISSEASEEIIVLIVLEFAQSRCIKESDLLFSNTVEKIKRKELKSVAA